jgi:hypothetical protein
MIERRCGDCQLCCKLLPMKRGAYPPEHIAETVGKMIAAGIAEPRDFAGMTLEFDKPAGERCPHQCVKGCAIYPRRPFGCRFWNCRWLVNDDTAELRRPDRCHYVIDIMPDFVTAVDNGTGQRRTVQVVQVWIDPKHPHVHRDPALRAYLARRAEQGIAALIRFNERDAFVLLAPALSSDRQWHEITGGLAERQHTGKQILAALGG